MEETKIMPGGPADKAPARSRKKIKVPNKRTINLATVNEQKFQWSLAVPGVILIILAAAIFAKFAVIDRLEAVNEAQAAARAVQRQVDAANQTIEDYGELNDIYAHYTYSGFTTAELELVDRVEVMDLLERVVLPRTPLDAWTLNGNQLSMSIDGSTLQDINLTVQALQAEDIVAFCNVSTAATNTQRIAGGLDDPDNEVVTASIQVYLAQAKEAEEP